MTTTAELEELGLRLNKISQLHGTISFEKPISIINTSLTGELHLGMFTYFGNGCRVIDADIGRYCSISRNVVLNMRDHPIDWLSSHPFQYDGTQHFNRYDEWHEIKSDVPLAKKTKENRVSVGNDVWIGENVMIKRGVNIGNGAILAAGSVVTKNVPDYMIVGGTPAKQIRLRFNEKTVQELQRLKWWEWDLRTISKEIPFDNIKRAIKFIDKKIKRKKISRLPLNFVSLTSNRKEVTILSNPSSAEPTKDKTSPNKSS